jgi:hypothetical protein
MSFTNNEAVIEINPATGEEKRDNSVFKEYSCRTGMGFGGLPDSVGAITFCNHEIYCHFVEIVALPGRAAGVQDRWPPSTHNISNNNMF